MLLFVGWTALAYLFPPNGDDWAWGSQIGLTRLHRFFAGYNGRYVADLAIIGLTRAPILAAIIVGAALTATIHLILAITKNRTPLGYGVVAAVMLAMPHALWSQAISWLSGTVNYVGSTLWVLVFLRFVQLDWQRRAERPTSPARAAGIAVFAFAAALFMENVTVFFVVASIVVLIAQRRTFGRVSRAAWCWAGGFLAGAAAMFSNSAYRRASTGRGYQQMTGLSGFFGTLTGPFSQFAVVENMVLDLVVAVLITALAISSWRRSGRRACLLVILPAVLCVAISLPLAVADDVTQVSAGWQSLGGAATGLLLVALCATAWLLIESASRRRTLLCLVGSCVLILGPLLVVSPIGPRCFWVAYVLMLAMVSVLLAELGGRMRKVAATRMAALGALVALGLVVSDFAVYVPMSGAAVRRVDHIRQQVTQGATTVVVDPLPYSSYTHLPDPLPGRWAHRYKLYYGIPQSVTIKLAPSR